MNRAQAETALKNLFGFDYFHDLQWKVIEQLLAGKRVLFIEKTGYGKSLCYQFPATQLKGVTIVFSPLIALMRDQVQSMTAKGIRAASINSNQTREENHDIIERAKRNEIDILYISPERLENAAWISAAREMNIAMVVIDEAHCISMWGQSFRPNYRRIVDLVRLLPRDFPVLATTATATPRVQEDIVEQVGSDLIPVRGELLRSNIRLFVVPVKHEDEKYYWLAEHLPRLGKSGIVYTGTQTNTDLYANWLQFLDMRSAAYNGRLDSDSRVRIEAAFMGNEYDCVVSTNALGMGIDKPDIRFIIHTQIPQSPIHYYQEVGRAGRDGKEAFAILLYNPETDEALPRAFIEGSKPSPAKYLQVIELTRQALLSRNEIIRQVNMKQTHVSVILADLVAQGILNEMQGKSKMYFYNPNAPEFDFSLFANLKESQESELQKMLEYTGISSCRMVYLCGYLGDTRSDNCGVCDNDTGVVMPVTANDAIVQKLSEFRGSYFPVLEVASAKSNLLDGVAASYYGLSNVGTTIKHCKYEAGGDFPDWLLRLALKAFRKQYGNAVFDIVLSVPPTESGNLVQNFAEKFARLINVPYSDKLIKTGVTQPQKLFQSSMSKKENLQGKFAFSNPPELAGKRVLLLDDVFDSGCTIKEIGQCLTKAGALSIAPLVIARTVGGDL
ncbi:MAG: RecQ family ATP-dependent DNA helicase [Bacteroidetes bacterium]|nr:RecQ family ATP-dependent DNA helicase [Bacteroidota bacterium]